MKRNHNYSPAPRVRLNFKTGTYRFAIALLAAASPCLAVDLTKETADAFDRYIAATEARMEPRIHAGAKFLSTAESSEWRQQAMRGAPIVKPTVPNGVVPVQGGLIQDWTGAIFVPKATLKDALTVAQDYEHHGDVYKPDVASAKLTSRNGDRFEVYMRIVKSKLWITDVLNTDHEIRFAAVDPHRAYSRSYSKRIAEVNDAGKKNERELKVGQDRGYLWRMYGYWFFEESDGGVYVSCQSITLTRDLPFALSHLLGPILRELPGEAVGKSLEQTRNAILAISQAGR